jgi:hypothetical protein
MFEYWNGYSFVLYFLFLQSLKKSKTNNNGRPNSRRVRKRGKKDSRKDKETQDGDGGEKRWEVVC